MMANLVLAAFIVKSAVSAQMEYAKSTLGGTVSVQADMDTIRENQKAEMEKGGDPGEMFKEMNRRVIWMRRLRRRLLRFFRISHTKTIRS